MSKTVFDVLIENISAQRALFAESMVTGGPKDWPEYRELCGLIRGLEIAQREIRDLSRNYLDDDND